MAAPSTRMITAWGCSFSLIIRSPKVRLPWATSFLSGAPPWAPDLNP